MSKNLAGIAYGAVVALVVMVAVLVCHFQAVADEASYGSAPASVSTTR